jgi:hypothetical protein
MELESQERSDSGASLIISQGAKPFLGRRQNLRVLSIKQ